MFEFVRNHNRLLQLLLLLLIFPSFVFFGVQGYSQFTDGANTTLAKVDGQAIKQTEFDAVHRQQIERIRQQMPNVDVKLFDTPEMKKQTLEGLVRERVLAVAAAKEHLVVGDERLQRLFIADPQYAALRNADGSVNREFLAARGLSSEGFAQQLRQDLSTRQVLGGVTNSQITGTAVSNAALNALLEKRELQMQAFSTAEYLAKASPTDADVEAYYKSHANEFRSAEEARIEYAVLDLDALKKQVSASEADLKKYYDENVARYTAAEERRASHILIASPKDAPAADRAKAKAKAEALLAEVRKNPASFAAVAKKESQDPGSAEKGGDLDFFSRGAMVKPFEDAAFSMKPDEISNVVESDFGFHIIKLTAIRGGERKPFEAVKAEITDEVAKQLAQARYVEAADQFSNTVYEQSDSLQPVIDKLKLTKATATVKRTPAPGATGPLASPKLLEAIFSADSVKNKRNTEAVETAPNQLVSARIVEYKPERVLPLADVRAQVLEKVRTSQALAAARKDGEARLAAIQKNPAESLPQTVTVSRSQAQSAPRQVVEAALKADLSKGPAVVGVDLGDQGYAVVKVTKLVPREANDPDNERARPFISQALANAESQAYYEALKKRYKVDIKVPVPGAAASAAN